MITDLILESNLIQNSLTSKDTKSTSLLLLFLERVQIRGNPCKFQVSSTVIVVFPDDADSAIICLLFSSVSIFFKYIKINNTIINGSFLSECMKSIWAYIKASESYQQEKGFLRFSRFDTDLLQVSWRTHCVQTGTPTARPLIAQINRAAVDKLPCQ